MISFRDLQTTRRLGNAHMEENRDTKTPLDAYVSNAKMVVLATGIIGAVLAFIAGLSQADAQSKLAGGTSMYSSGLSSAVTVAGGVLVIAEALLGICAIAAVMWALARLAVAYKDTK